MSGIGWTIFKAWSSGFSGAFVIVCAHEGVPIISVLIIAACSAIALAGAVLDTWVKR